MLYEWPKGGFSVVLYSFHSKYPPLSIAIIQMTSLPSLTQISCEITIIITITLYIKIIIIVITITITDKNKNKNENENKNKNGFIIRFHRVALSR